VLPLDVAECTAAFFSDAFERSVTNVELLDRSSGTTGRARFGLRGDGALPPTVFVKLAPFDESQRAFVNSVGMGVSEARFYRDVAADVPVRVPRAYYAETDGDRYVMVLEDLDATGCRFPAPTDPDVEFRARDIVEQLGALHARYWESSRFDDGGDLAWLAGKGTGDAGGGATFVQMAVDNLGDQLDADFHRIAELYLARAPDIVGLWNSGPRTLVHGDPHMGNLFVDEQAGNRTGFLDWAVLGRSPGMRDVAYVLCNSVPAGVRGPGEKAWIARYCEVLGAAGIEYAFDEAWRQYRLFAVYSWVAAASTAGMGSKWQPLHIGLGGTRRATAACTALGSVELLEELLG
jgi:aminoglycoside phosphotransferase (APT) family kinase protein